MWSKVIVCLLININLLVTAEYVGDLCVPNKFIAVGKCALITNCEAAIRQIKIKRGHDLRHCGFEGLVEIVCCPLNDGTRFGTISTESSTNALWIADTVSTESSTNAQRIADTASTERSTNALRIADRECQKIMDSAIPPLDMHILGGVVASLGEFPHMVAVGYAKDNTYEFNCAGSIISKDYVLTAAHCVSNIYGVEPIFVRTGIVELESNEWNSETDVGIAQIIKHPNFTFKKKYHDLALLRLNQSLVFTSGLNAACLHTSDEDSTLPLVITGWGSTSNAMYTRSKLLLKASVIRVPNEKCSEFYSNWRKLPQGIVDSQVCAGDPNGINDTCQGDSGGPLQSLNKDNVYRVVGITSFGRGCGSTAPGVYTRVAKYIDWLESVVWAR